jgi:transcriptional regulator with XRE-family HTH domain
MSKDRDMDRASPEHNETPYRELRMSRTSSPITAESMTLLQQKAALVVRERGRAEQMIDHRSGISNLGPHMKSLRLKAGLQEAALAEILGCSWHSVAKVEGGMLIDLDFYVRWAYACGIDPREAFMDLDLPDLAVVREPEDEPAPEVHSEPVSTPVPAVRLVSTPEPASDAPPEEPVKEEPAAPVVQKTAREAAGMVAPPPEVIRKSHPPSKCDPYQDEVGHLSDSVIAAKAGLTIQAVSNYRKRRNIPAYYRGETAAQPLAPSLRLREKENLQKREKRAKAKVTPPPAPPEEKPPTVWENLTAPPKRLAGGARIKPAPEKTKRRRRKWADGAAEPQITIAAVAHYVWDYMKDLEPDKPIHWREVLQACGWKGKGDAVRDALNRGKNSGLYVMVKRGVYARPSKTPKFRFVTRGGKNMPSISPAQAAKRLVAARTR